MCTAGAVCVLFLPIQRLPLQPSGYVWMVFVRVYEWKCYALRDAVICDVDLRPSMADKWATWQTRVMCMLRVRADGGDRHWNIDTNLGYAATATAPLFLYMYSAIKSSGNINMKIQFCWKNSAPPHAAFEAWKVIKRVQITHGCHMPS